MEFQNVFKFIISYNIIFIIFAIINVLMILASMLEPIPEEREEQQGGILPVEDKNADAHTGPPSGAPAHPIIFVLSLPKNGTTSLQHAFESAGLQSAHWVTKDAQDDLWWDGKYLTDIRNYGYKADQYLVGRIVQENLAAGQPILSGKLEGLHCLAQMDYLYWKKNEPSDPSEKILTKSPELLVPRALTKIPELLMADPCKRHRALALVQKLQTSAKELVQAYLRVLGLQQELELDLAETNCTEASIVREMEEARTLRDEHIENVEERNQELEKLLEKMRTTDPYYEPEQWTVEGYFPQCDEDFIREALKSYPTAKFILTTRDPAKWVKSVSGWNSLRERMTVWDHRQLPAGVGEKDEEMVRFYEDHVSFVRRVVPAERLLLFDLADDLGETEKKLRHFLAAPALQWGHFNATIPVAEKK